MSGTSEAEPLDTRIIRWMPGRPRAVYMPRAGTLSLVLDAADTKAPELFLGMPGLLAGRLCLA